MILALDVAAHAQQRNQDREAANATAQAFAPKFATQEEATDFQTLNVPDHSARIAAADAFIAKYPTSQLIGYAHRFRMESFIALGRFADGLAAGEIGLTEEQKYVDALIAQADADAANRNRRDRNAPPPIDKNSQGFKDFMAEFDKTQMFYYQNLMRAAQEVNNIPKVTEYGDKALVKNQNDPYTLITMSNVLARRVPSDPAQAEQALRRAEDISKRAVSIMTQLVNNNPGLAPSQRAAYLGGVNVSLGLVHFNQKKYGDAEKAFQAALAVDNRDAEAYMLLGMTYVNMRQDNRVDAALENLAKSVFLKGPTEQQARESLTQVYQAAKKSLDGLDQFIAASGAKIQ
jgi:tetratricopeptide (TPR) repeat protein